jgi:hypothetical protein
MHRLHTLSLAFGRYISPQTLINLSLPHLHSFFLFSIEEAATELVVLGSYSHI